MQELPETRRSLLVALRENRDEAWAEFLQLYEEAIHSFCRKRGLQDADARDVTQDVLVAVTNQISQFKDNPAKGKFRGWLFRVARNIAVNKFYEVSRRAASGDSEIVQLLNETPDARDSEASEFWLEYRRALLAWAAEQVRPQVHENSWQAFWFSAVDGLPAKEIARQLEMRVGSIYVAKCRVFAKIRSVIAELDDIDDFESEIQKRVDPNSR